MQKYKGQRPLEIWNSKDVADLLYEFYSRNFSKAGIDQYNLADKLVNETFAKKNYLSESELKKNIINIFKAAKKAAKHKPTEKFILDHFDLSNVKTFLDYGANKLNTINRLSISHPSIEKFIAVDVQKPAISFQRPEISKFIQTDENSERIDLPDESIDFINVQYVLHHLKSKDQVVEILKEFRRILSPSGKLLIWEETFTEKYWLKDIDDAIDRGFQSDLDLTKNFFKLTHDQRWEFIIANDWLINANNQHLQWNYQYFTAETWMKMLSENSFLLEDKLILNLRVNGHLKQGVNGIFLLKKS